MLRTAIQRGAAGYGVGKMWTVLGCCVVVLLCFGALVTAADIESGWYRITPKISGMCVEVQGSNEDNGGNVIQWGYNGGDNQLWRFDSVGDNRYAIFNRHSGLCLEVGLAGGDTTGGLSKGDNVRQWEYFGQANQKWRLEPAGGGYYRIVCQYSGMCLDVAGPSNVEGANLYQWDCHGLDNQLFKLEPVWRPVPGAYAIRSKHSGKCIEVQGSGTVNGSNVAQNDLTGSDNQLWEFVRIGGGQPDGFRIMNVHSGLCLEVGAWGDDTPGAGVDGGNVRQWEYVGGDNQKWKIERVAGGFLRITSVYSGKCLDVANLSLANGGNIYQWSCHGWDNQQWSIELLDPDPWNQAGAEEPLLNSVIAVSGNNDLRWGPFIFLHGLGPARQEATGKLLTPYVRDNHCPDDWLKVVGHVGDASTAPYFEDADRTGSTSTGQDSSWPDGIDQYMLAFRLSHGCWDYYNVNGGDAQPADMQLGDGEDGGLLRYLWNASCLNLAHGERCAPDNGCHPNVNKPCPLGFVMCYTTPGSFDGSPDTDAMRNAFQRWAPAFSPSLRMVCGFSNCAAFPTTVSDSIWDCYNNKKYSVANSWLYGTAYSVNVPICMTIGGNDYWKTPMFDARFTNVRNTSGATHMYLRYATGLFGLFSYQTQAVPEGSAAGAGGQATPPVPTQLPVFALNPAPVPGILGELYDFEDAVGWLNSIETLGGETAVRLATASGATYVAGVTEDEYVPGLTDDEYVTMAEGHLESLGLLEDSHSGPVVVRSMVQQVPFDLESRTVGPELVEFQSDVAVVYQRVVNIEDLAIPVLGLGGRIEVLMNNDGSLLGISKVWREIEGVIQYAAVKTYDAALDEALLELAESVENPGDYSVASWTWGYHEGSGIEEQGELRVKYLFQFLPNADLDDVVLSPVVIEVWAQ